MNFFLLPACSRCNSGQHKMRGIFVMGESEGAPLNIIFRREAQTALPISAKHIKLRWLKCFLGAVIIALDVRL